MRRRLVLLALIMMVTATSVSPVRAEAAIEWPAWRGPQRNGVAIDAAGQVPPTKWSETEGVRWKTPVPGRGHSSPIVVGSRILLTTADEQAKTQSVLCYDRLTGRQMWATQVSEGGFTKDVHKKNTHATPTVASDGHRVFVVFNNYDSVQLSALSLDGKKLWQKSVGAYQPKQYRFGYAPSPALHKGLVIVASEFDGDSYLAALDGESGREAWRIARPKVVTYSSPIVAQVAGRDQLIMSGADQVVSYDPDTGKQLWAAAAIAPATCGTVVWSDTLVFASGGYPKKQTAGIKADGSGEVVWRNGTVCYEQSMLYHKGYVYAVDDSGVAHCWKADDGTEMWRERLGGDYSASPILANGHIYAANEKGTMYVFRADPSGFNLVARNQLGDEGFATIAIVGSDIYLRTASGSGGDRQETLYCLSDPQR